MAEQKSTSRSGNYVTYQQRKTKSGKPRWRALVRYKGQTAVSKTAPRKTDLETWASDTLNDMIHKRFAGRHEAERHSVADVVSKYKEQIEGDEAKAKAGQPRQLDWFAAEIGTLTLAELTPAVLSECRDKLAKAKSGPTANRFLAALSKALTVAERDWGWITENPMRRVSRKPENPWRVRFLSDDARDSTGKVVEEGERTRLLKACKASTLPALYPIVVLALSTGMRQGEILTLTWGQVDLARGWITLEKTKNKDRRGLPLTGHALDVLKDWSGAGNVRHLPGASVFPGLEGASGHFRRAWDKAVIIANVHDFHFHDLRHTAASALLMSGASLGEIADVLGHKTLQMVKRYAHIADDHRAAVVSRMNATLFQ